jgi:cell division protein ZapA
MAQVPVTLNGRRYEIACDDGQEEHLQQLAAYVDEKLARLVTAVGQVGDTKLLAIASLLLADELVDANETGGDGGPLAAARQRAEDSLGASLDELAERVETIAARLEGA